MPESDTPFSQSLIFELVSQLCHRQAILLLCQAGSLRLVRFVIGPGGLTELCLLPASWAAKCVLCSECYVGFCQ